MPKLSQYIKKERVVDSSRQYQEEAAALQSSAVSGEVQREAIQPSENLKLPQVRDQGFIQNTIFLFYRP